MQGSGRCAFSISCHVWLLCSKTYNGISLSRLKSVKQNKRLRIIMVLYDDEKKTEKTYKKEVKRNVPQHKHQRKISAALKKEKKF